jgi:hypothetical protein
MPSSVRRTLMDKVRVMRAAQGLLRQLEQTAAACAPR